MLTLHPIKINMDLSTIISTLHDNILHTSYIEIVAVFFGLLSVWYARNEKVLLYPTGIINVCLYIYICIIAKLYADMGINVFYLIMSIYGWYYWTRKDEQQHVVPITKCSLTETILNIIATLCFFGIIYFILKKYTDSTVPVLDSFTTAIFIIGMWLQARKKIENWIYWIVGDTLVIPLFAYKGYVFTGVQFAVFLGLAVSGYIEWKKKLNDYNPKLYQGNDKVIKE